MQNTKATEVFDAFESTFSDKKEIAQSLECQWLKMAISRYNMEIAVNEKLTYDEELMEFDNCIDPYVILTLGQIIRVFYQEREASRVNKIASVVGKDMSINGQNNLAKNAKSELDYHGEKARDYIENQKPTALI